MSNESYRQRDVWSLWHPYTRIRDAESEPFPVIIRGEGIYLYDADGNRYIDGISSWWAVNLGHGHPQIVNAIKRQAETLQHSMIGGMSHPCAIELAEKLISVCPKGLSKVFFASDGSSAVEAALKIAVQYWRNIGRPRKTQFASLQDGYHGDTLGAVSVGKIDSFHRPFAPLLFPVHKARSPYCYRCPERKRQGSCNTECFASMEEIVESRADELAAVIVEPLNQAAAGMRIYPAEYLAKLSELCKKHEVLLIVDEIAMGYGRSGKMFACEYASITPDVMCLGKGMAAGYLPISATVVTDEIYTSFRDTPELDRTFYHGHTFTGNPICAAAAIETLNVYEDEQILDNLIPSMEAISTQLETLAKLDVVGDVRQIGMVAALELRSQSNNVTQIAKLVCMEALKRGALLRPLGGVIYLWPPLTITPEQTGELGDILGDSIECAV